MKSLDLSKITLFAGVSKLEDIPKERLPHIAIIGRSNVGKSSLINHLANRKSLAKISKTAGKTRRLDFYLVPHRFFLVDLPGYGYARVGSSLKEKWTDLIDGYLCGDYAPQAVIFLLDSRHMPTDQDLQFWQWLNAHDIAPIVILTKCDKLKKNEQKVQKEKIAHILGMGAENLIMYDIYSASGRSALEQQIAEVL